MKRLIRFLFCMLVCFYPLMPAVALEWIDATHLFDNEARWLADNAIKESRSMRMLRTRGIVMYADTKPLAVGDELVFTTMNIEAGKPEKTPAVLKKIGKHCYVFVEKGKTLAQAVVDKVVGVFDEKIYPTDTSVFGPEWKPGIDDDDRIVLLFLDIKDGYQANGPNKGYVAGYFYPGDEYTKDQNPQSNEREMLYLDIYPGNPAEEEYMGVVAHEFQHMIHWHHDPKEHTWVNESMSQLATFLNGFDHPSQVFAFIKAPDNNLCAWSEETAIANYGQVYLFAYYMMMHAVSGGAEERKAFVRDLVANKAHGTEGYEKTLKTHGGKLAFSQYFDAFNVANHFNDPTIASGLYGYDKNLGRLKLEPMIVHKSAPFTGKGTIKCWSARSVLFNIGESSGKIKVSFVGQRQTAQKASNAWSVAAVLFNKTGKVKPAIEWLKVTNGKAEQTLAASAEGYDSLMLVFVNRGHEGGDLELPFAKAAPPAPFAYSVGIGGKQTSTRVAAAPRRTSSSSRTSSSRSSSTTRRTNVRHDIEAIASRQPLAKQIVGFLADGSNVTASIADSAVNNEYENLQNEEAALFETISESLISGDASLFNDFVAVWSSTDANGRENLLGLRTRLLDFLRFETMQNGKSELERYIPALEE